ncbi:hypothetical protein [Microbacterium sp. 18062]|uniref:hypothetical protein n=1 Tax=Microbacterium sp. 18062 TaxID=2681410 RepID=UPI00190F7FC8|nr:hypothetical protein [Microbacterium sp. 18062]
MTSSLLGPSPDMLTTSEHEHAWRTESAHTTSEGRVLYVECVACGTRRVDLQPHTGLPPTALSTMVAPTRSGR